MDLKELTILGNAVESHWYYRSKAAALTKYLGPTRYYHVLDVGAGSGFFTRHLLRHTQVLSGLCVDSGYDKDTEESYCGKPIAFRRACNTVDADLVLLMDVLEHVEDDSGLLATYAQKVPRGTHFVITVPAFRWLWSRHDVYLGHYRRYDLRGLEAAVSKARLAVEHISYYFGLVLPIAMAMRLPESISGSSDSAPRSQLRQHGRLANTALEYLCRAELPLLRTNRLGGLSLFCHAIKTEPHPR